MHIIERYRIRQSVEHALDRDEQRDMGAAVRTAAYELGLTVEVVEEAIEVGDGEACL